MKKEKGITVRASSNLLKEIQDLIKQQRGYTLHKRQIIDVALTKYLEKLK